MKNEPFIVRERRKDEKKSITLRIDKDTLKTIDELAAETNYSRSELINMLISYGMQHIKIDTETI